MKIPEPHYSVANLIDLHHEKIAEPPRSHMGCSQLGHHCDRWLWLSFRWAVQPKFHGRILRLFRRGHEEEANIIKDLRAIGVDIRGDIDGKQARVDFGSHVSGSLDGIIEAGVPESPRKRHIAEFKTHGKKSFDDLEKHGVEKSKPMHYVQMQIYMDGVQIDRALYLAVCKDDDRIYTERVSYVKEIAEKAIHRGQRLALSDRMPPPISTDPSWYQCRFCDAHKFCHQTKTTEHVNCRTCAHSTAKPDSTWRCERHDAENIPVDFQRIGCNAHTLHPDLVPYDMRESSDDWTAVYVIDGQEVKNGEPAPGVFSSSEILANPKLCATPDSALHAMREKFNASITK